jgi:hypothetical protein
MDFSNALPILPRFDGCYGEIGRKSKFWVRLNALVDEGIAMDDKVFGRKPIEALFAKIFRHLSELDALVDVQIGYWIRRHKFSQQELLNDRIFDKIDAWCGSLDSMMSEWERVERLDAELRDFYYSQKILLEKELGRIRVKILHRRETLSDAAVRVVNNAFDKIMNWIARKLGISSLVHRRADQITFRKNDDDDDDDDHVR